jgi:hypothetical protein
MGVVLCCVRDVVERFREWGWDGRRRGGGKKVGDYGD